MKSYFQCLLDNLIQVILLLITSFNDQKTIEKVFDILYKNELGLDIILINDHFIDCAPKIIYRL